MQEKQEQPLALVLANALLWERPNVKLHTRQDAAAELRRLHAEIEALREALKEIADDYADRFDLDDPSTNPGIKYTIKQARAALEQGK